MKKNINKNICLILIGNFISRVGTSVFFVSLLWWITKNTGSSKYIGYVMGATILPNALIGPLGGVISDRYNKKYILIIADIFSGMSSITMGILAHFDYFNMEVIVLLNLIMGISSSIFDPSIRSIIPRLTKREHIIKTNSVFSVNSAITKIVGPVAAGVMLSISFIGIKGAFFVNGISFLISAFLEMFLSYEHKINNDMDTASIKKDIKEGIVYILQNNNLRQLLIAASVANIFLACFTILMPLFISKVLQEEVNYYSLIMAMESVGGIVIGLIFLMFKKVQINLKHMKLCIIALGFILLLIPISKLFHPTILILAMCFGMLSVLFDNTYFTYLQTTTNPELMGRVFSVVFAVANICIPISYFIYGILGDYLLSELYVISGICVLACSLIIKVKKKINV